MLQTGSSPPRLDGLVVLVVDATTGVGRELTTRLSAAGALVAVVGAGHPVSTAYEAWHRYPSSVRPRA